MDLLSDESTGSNNDCDGDCDCDGDSNVDCASEKGVEEITITTTTTAISSKCIVTKRKRGSVVLLSSKEAPADLFERIVPHRRGHWSGHVLVPVSQYNAPAQAVQSSIHRFHQLLEHNGFSGTIIQHTDTPLHLSLSKLFSLQLAFIDSFVHKLSQRLAMERTTRLFVEQKGTILVNDEKTRSFWCWKVQSNQTLLRILHHVDSIMKDYGQPGYYDPPIFHLSLASFNGNLEALSFGIDDEYPASKEEDDDHEEDDDNDEYDQLPFLNVDRIVCQFGTTKTHTIPLAPP